jgi:endogenous inhibitor of DNA gyrase (YacG/DUF329 family)
MAESICPICGKRVQREKAPESPFCSNRCRQIDLGRWLGQSYSIPEAEQSDSSEYPDDEDFSDAV